MTREDRELLAELARLNRDMVPLAMAVMEDSVGVAEQAHYGDRLIAAGKRLRRRANQMAGTIVEGEVLVNGPLTIPAHTVEPQWER